MKSFKACRETVQHNYWQETLLNALQGELQQEVLEHVSVEGHRALAHFRKGHPLIPGMTLKVHSLSVDFESKCIYIRQATRES